MHYNNTKSIVSRNPHKLSNIALRFVQLCPTTAPDAIWTRFIPDSMLIRTSRSLYIDCVKRPMSWCWWISDSHSLCCDSTHTGRFCKAHCYSFIFDRASSSQQTFMVVMLNSTWKYYTKRKLVFWKKNVLVRCKSQMWDYFFAIWSYRMLTSTITLLWTDCGGDSEGPSFSLSLPLSSSHFVHKNFAITA